MSQRTEEIFHHTVQTLIDTSETAPDLLDSASDRIVEALLGEHKILTCGNGSSAALAQLLATRLVDRFERERPGLPALSLNGDGTGITSIANSSNFTEVFAKPLRALGQEGDVLVVLTTSGNPSNLVQAVRAARSRNMSILILGGRDGGNIASLLTDDDLELRVPSNHRNRIHEIHLVLIHCLLDAIDRKLFGDV